ncbi:hypothetical protein [Terriglobus sp.]|uniref:hypothetical protein n=1 Tax=Terriglobus sp. TaxID=1889013 RepID=UPI003AFFB4F9
MQSIAFPLRLQESGLLRRDDRAASVLSLLQVMARTPQGSWRACPEFGLRDLFEDGRQRADLPRLVAERINGSLADLGLEEYQVTEVIREISSNRDMDAYSIRLENQGTAESLTTSVVYEV